MTMTSRLYISDIRNDVIIIFLVWTTQWKWQHLSSVSINSFKERKENIGFRNNNSLDLILNLFPYYNVKYLLKTFCKGINLNSNHSIWEMIW